jgi:hypothetical protein
MPFYLREFKIGKYKISFAVLSWLVISFITIVLQTSKGSSHYNNYLIFKGVFEHTISLQPLYNEYPAEYFDTNHYGPFFSLLIAPFAALPNFLGVMLWGLANVIVLIYAVKKLPISETDKNIILLIGLIELLTSLHNLQFNPMATGFIILSYTLVKEKKDFWATLFIAGGLLVKLYGIVGLAFFLFSERKHVFILSLIFWSAVCFTLPMLISSPEFIIQGYTDWYHSLVSKNEVNNQSAMQGMTAKRVVERVLGVKSISNGIIILAAALIYVCTLLRYKYFKDKQFQLNYLASLLIGVVIFSSSAESATYIIAIIGISIWFVNQPQKKTWVIALLIFAILFTSLSTTDLFPKYIKTNFIRPYALKALPCLVIWLVLMYELLFKKPETLSSQT